MTSLFLRLRNQMGTPEGRQRVIQELLERKQTYDLAISEKILLDQAKNWNQHLDNLKNAVLSAQGVLKKVENHVYGNVVEFRRKK